MTEFYTVKRIDNSHLVRPASPAQMRDLWHRLAAGVVLAACLLVYAWQHFECIQIRYRIEQLDVQRAQAAELNQQLQLEVATLRSPGRVETIARNELGLTVPVPSQVAPTAEGAAANAVVAEAQLGQSAARP